MEQDNIAKKIELFKAKTIDFALNYINENGEYANIRELKDLTSIVDSIEKSYKVEQVDNQNQITNMFTKIIAKFETDIKDFNNDTRTTTLCGYETNEKALEVK